MARCPAVGTIDLISAMRDMLDNPDYSDVKFCCKDGVEVQASRLLLVGRSSVFKSLLIGPMDGSSLSTIPLPAVESVDLLRILELLYTGVLAKHLLFTFTEGLNLVKAARIFLLPAVEEVAWKWLVDLSNCMLENDEVSESASTLSNLLSTEGHFDIVSKNHEVIVHNLIWTLESSSLLPIHLNGLSEAALKLYLMNTIDENGSLHEPSLEEYLKLRSIVLWLGCQVSLQEAKEVVSLYVPDAKSAVGLLKDVEKLQIYAAPDDASMYVKHMLAGNVSKSTLSSLLSTVNLQRIHAQLLVKVIVPLDLFPSSEIIAALASHVLRRPGLGKAPTCHWQENSFKEVNVAGNGSVIEVGDKTITIAKGTSIMWPSGVYEWVLTFDNHLWFQTGLVRFGSIEQAKWTFPTRRKFMRAWNDFRLGQLQDVETVQCADTDVVFWSLKREYRRAYYTAYFTKENLNKWTAYGDGEVKIEDGHNNVLRIRVHLNMDERSCKFFINGKDCGVAWRNLPDGVYFPILEDQNPSTSVKIDLITGFDGV